MTMNITTIKEKLGTAPIWSYNTNSWINPSDLLKYDHYFVYGDPRGDTLVRAFSSVEDLKLNIEKYLNRECNDCDFATELYLVVVSGEIKKIKVQFE